MVKKPTFRGVVIKNQHRGGALPKKGGRLGQLANLRGGGGTLQERGGGVPNAHYVDFPSSIFF